MKITKQYLKQLIKEELQKTMSEGDTEQALRSALEDLGINPDAPATPENIKAAAAKVKAEKIPMQENINFQEKLKAYKEAIKTATMSGAGIGANASLLTMLMNGTSVMDTNVPIEDSLAKALVITGFVTAGAALGNVAGRFMNKKPVES